MARRRMIDPNFWQSEDVSKLTVRQRLLLIGLFSNADDEGKLRGNPAFIRSIIFSYEDFTIQDITDDLNYIEKIGSIEQYIVDESRYIRLVNWFKFQRVDKPQKSVIPNPIIDKRDSNSHSRNDYEKGSEHDDADSDFDSRLKEEKLKEEKRNEEKGKEANLTELPANLNEIKNRLRLLTIECGLKGVGIDGLETIYTYIGQVETGVIEKAIKKAEKKHVPYFVTIINGMIEEGKTTVASLNPIPPPGAPPEIRNGNGNQRSRSGKPSMPVVKDNDQDPQMTEEEYIVAVKRAYDLAGKDFGETELNDTKAKWSKRQGREAG
ncbi:hypothetical protein [Cohnella kolymensis]|uniref:hypothetical protein n=1 Tax=Cohnella kolymensis TaxID=1590652 RepID=UPI000696054F|nr:hypothetical protein [Cohnella kolymensis]